MAERKTDRAKFYRDKAEEARVKAESVKDPKSRKIILEIADMWDRLTERAQKKSTSN